LADSANKLPAWSGFSAKGAAFNIEPGATLQIHGNPNISLEGRRPSQAGSLTSQRVHDSRVTFA